MKTSSTGVTVAFTAAALAKCAFVISCAMQYALLLRAPISSAEAQANNARQLGITRLVTPIALLALLVFFIWFYRTKKSAIQAGMAETEYSPGFSVGCFFIPIANLGLPFQAMEELWRGSLNPVGWKTERSSLLVGWWWASWIAHSIFPFVALIQSKSSTGNEGLKSTTILLAISGVLAVICFAVTIVLVRRVSGQLNLKTEGFIAGPNQQTPLPTPPSVTDRADASSAPDAGAADL